MLELLESLAALAYAKPPDEEEEDKDKDDQDDQDEESTDDDESDDSDDDDKGDSDEDDSDDDSKEEDSDEGDSEDDEEPKEKKDKALAKTYPEEVVKRLRTENKKRRQKEKASTDRIKELEADLKESKKGRTAPKKGASSRLEEEIDTLKNQVGDLTNKNAELVELQTATDQVLTIGKIADEVGFNDATDAVAFLSTRTSEFTSDDGEIDEDALRSELEELLEEKAYLGSGYTQERKEKEAKGRKEAAKTQNKSSSQKIDAPSGKKGKSQSEEEVNKEIRQKLNQTQDGRAALKIFLSKKYLPKTKKESVSVS